MKPIPKSLLIHTAELKAVTRDSWQNEMLETIDNLSKIRIEPSTKLIATKDNRQVTLLATLIYDCYNSRPVGVSFTHGQKIICNGVTYTIEAIDQLYDGRKLHHIELGLI